MSHIAPTIDDELRAALAFPERFNLAEYFLDRRMMEGFGEQVAIIDYRGRVTYRELQAMANRVANALVAEGVRAEDRVLIGLFDSIEFAATFFGVLKCGAVVAMVNAAVPFAAPAASTLVRLTVQVNVVVPAQFTEDTPVPAAALWNVTPAGNTSDTVSVSPLATPPLLPSEIV